MDLKIEMRQRIDRLLAKRSEMSLRAISLKCGVPYTTFWNIYQGKTSPNFSQSLSILSVVSDSPDTNSTLQKYFPDEAKATANINSILNVHTKLDSEQCKEHLYSTPGNIIHTIAASRNGITHEKVRMLFGSAGEDSLDEMIASEMLQVASDGVIRGPNNFSYSTAEDLICNFTTKISAMNRSLVGTPGFLLAEQTESVSLEALEDVRRILLLAYKEIYSILSNESNNGPFPIFVGLAASLLDKTEFQNNMESKT